MQLTLTEKDLEGAPPKVRAWLLSLIPKDIDQPVEEEEDSELVDTSTLDSDSTQDLQPLSTMQARRLVAGLRPRSRDFLRSIVKRNGDAKLSEVMGEMGVKYSIDLRGPWAGITNRLRRVVNDRNAVLITFDRTQDIRDGYGRVIESVYVMHPTAVNALKTVL
ncbi:MAG: hypothetical protein WED13_07550 [Methyloceanibacter sp.]